jgi:Transposase IS116/IS110/IS902 family
MLQINLSLYLFGWRVFDVSVGESWSGYTLARGSRARRYRRGAAGYRPRLHDVRTANAVPRRASGRTRLSSHLDLIGFLRAELSPAGRELVAVGLRLLEVFDLELAPLDRRLHAFARRQPGCRALIERLYGVGPVSATAILAELGDRRRFSSSDDAVRHAGLDITVYQSDHNALPRAPLARGGRSRLRWALYEAAVCAAHPTTPITARSPSGSAAPVPASRSPASSADAPTTRCANCASRRSPRSTKQQTRRRSQLPPDLSAPRAGSALVTKMLRDLLPQTARRQRQPGRP